MGETQREMTLDEWCARLPDSHLVNKQLDQLKKENKALQARLGVNMNYRLKNFLFRLFCPSFWHQIEKTCLIWDKALNEILDKNPNVVTGPYETKIGDLSIWTSNYPYSYGHPSNSSNMLPLPITRVRLRNYIAKKESDLAIKKASKDK